MHPIFFPLSMTPQIMEINLEVILFSHQINRMKSAYELAMERMGGENEKPPN